MQEACPNCGALRTVHSSRPGRLCKPCRKEQRARERAARLDAELGLPAGRWVNSRGTRRFVPDHVPTIQQEDTRTSQQTALTTTQEEPK